MKIVFAKWLSAATGASILTLGISFGALAQEAASSGENPGCTGPSIEEQIKERGVMRVSTGNAPPNQWIDTATNEFKGFNATILGRVAENLGVSIEPSIGTVASYAESVRTKRTDITSGLFKTPERAEVLDFSDAYKWTIIWAITLAGDESITKLEDLADKVVAVPFGSVEQKAGTALQEAGMIKEVLVAQTVPEVFEMMRTGRAQAAIEQGLTAEYAMRVRPDHAIRLAVPIEPKWMGIETATASYFLVEKTPCNQSFLKVINETIRELRESGEMEKIYAEYGLTDPTLWMPPAGWTN